MASETIFEEGKVAKVAEMLDSVEADINVTYS